MTTRYKVEATATDEGIRISLHRSDKTLRQVKIIKLADHVTEKGFLAACDEAKETFEAEMAKSITCEEPRVTTLERSKSLLEKLGW